MARNPLFSTYRQGENRVTSSMLAVFERIDLSLLDELLGAAAGEASLQMVSFVNQPPGRGGSILDGRISANFAYWFEVKTVTDALGRKQLEAHLQNLEGGDRDERLFLITPDVAEPKVVAELGDPRVVWFSFAALHDAIDHVLSGAPLLVSERAQFLLRELQSLFVDDGLLDHDDVVIVAARVAYGEYRSHRAYVCQPGRSFRDGLSYLGFYTNGAIQQEVPRILYREDAVPFSAEEVARRRASASEYDQLVGELIEKLAGASPRQATEAYQVFLLSSMEDERTITLDHPIVNTTTTAAGRPWAWTLQQRYLNSRQLRDPSVVTTGDLEE